MPEPTPANTSNDASKVPPFPPGDSDRGVSREANEAIGYGHPSPETNAALARIRDEQEAKLEDRPLRNPDAQAAQQATNEQGAQVAWLSTPDGKAYTSLTQKQSNGQRLSPEESQQLARIIARRENRPK